LNDLELLKLGRHFRLNLTTEDTEDTENTERKKHEESIKIIVGRNKKENEQIEKLAQSKDITLKPIDTVGPIVLIRNYKVGQDFNLVSEDKVIKVAAGLCARYSDKKDGLVKVKFNDIIIEAEPLDESLISKLRI
jgi:predicted ribosome quality control (RQC) complex YloA/Tae2 family protein